RHAGAISCSRASSVVVWGGTTFGGSVRMVLAVVIFVSLGGQRICWAGAGNVEAVYRFGASAFLVDPFRPNVHATHDASLEVINSSTRGGAIRFVADSRLRDGNVARWQQALHCRRIVSIRFCARLPNLGFASQSFGWGQPH